jgi:hypothetical protein
VARYKEIGEPQSISLPDNHWGETAFLAGGPPGKGRRLGKLLRARAEGAEAGTGGGGVDLRQA